MEEFRWDLVKGVEGDELLPREWFGYEGVYGLDFVADEIHNLFPANYFKLHIMNKNVNIDGSLSYVKVNRDYAESDLIHLGNGVYVTNKVVTVADMLEYKARSSEDGLFNIFEDADKELLTDVWKELVRRGTEEGQRQFKRFAGMCGCGFVFD